MSESEVAPRHPFPLSYYSAHSMDASTQPLLLPILSTLLQSPSPITLGASLTAFNAICPDNLSFLHPHYRRICRLLVDADEWGQVVALDILVRYARAMLEKPENSGSTIPEESGIAKKRTSNGEDDEEQEEMDPDIELLLHCAIPLFQSRNSAVVLGTVTLFYLIAPASNAEVGQDKLVRPLLRLMNGLEGEEVRAMATEVCRQVAEERPVCFRYSRGRGRRLTAILLSGSCQHTTARSCFIRLTVFESNVPRFGFSTPC